MRNLAIIPARGGSKRIPHKNIKDFLGKPIIAYSIEIALKSGLFDEVMVSTDDNEIAEIAKKYGANVPFLRTKKTSDDYATLSQVIDEVIYEYSKKEMNFLYVCCILPTAPFLTVDLLLRGYQDLIDRKLDSVRPIQRFSYPIQRAYKLVDNLVQYFYPEYEKTRSQDLETAFHDSGIYYWIKVESLKSNVLRGGIEISEIESHDIDSIQDWKIAEIKYEIISKFNNDENRIFKDR